MKKNFMYQPLIVMLLVFSVQACSVNPVTGKRQLTLITESQEIAIGEEQYPLMTQVSGGVFQANELQTYVNEVGQKLAKVSHRANLKYEFNVVNSSEINAYALPGGKISITRGLLARMKHEAQLAAVLGHEIGHVTAKHIAAGITRQMAAVAVLAVLSTYLEEKEVKHSEYYTLGGLLATQLMMLKFSRNQERQADELGIEYMSKVSYNTEGYVELLEILLSVQSREPTKIEGFLSSHPLTRDRIEAAKTKTVQSSTGSKNEREFERRTEVLRQVAPAYTHYDTAEKLMAEGKIQRAIAEYNQAIKMAPDQAVFYSDLAFAHFKADQLNQAKTNIDKSLRMYPDFFQSRFYSGLINSHLDNHQQALADFEQAEKLIPKQPPVRFYQGMCNEELGRKEIAVQKYREVLSLTTEGDYAKKAQERLKALGYDESEEQKGVNQ